MQIIKDYPLGKATTLDIGGPAKEFVEVKTEDQLIEAVDYAKQKNLEYMVIGGGSNLLVADEGVEKLVIKNSISGIVIPSDPPAGGEPRDLLNPNSVETDSSTIARNDKTIITVKSGTILQDLVNFSIKNNLAGLQKLAGIPGTVGGAIYGNAGAYGQSISDHLVEVTVVDPNVILGSEERATPKSDSGRTSFARMTFNREDCGFDYRFSNFKKNGYIILEAKFELEPGDIKIMTEEAANTIAQRAVKYPPGIKCPGSFFKNIVASSLPSEILTRIPPEKIVYGKVPAGTLLEEVGAKGSTKGDIEIAPYHANLFINKGNGNAKDFYALAKEMAEKVKEKFGIQLEPEVQLINLPNL